MEKATPDPPWRRSLVVLVAIGFFLAGIWGALMGLIHYPDPTNSDSAEPEAYWSFWGGWSAMLAAFVAPYLAWRSGPLSQGRRVGLALALLIGAAAVVCIFGPGDMS